MKPDLKSMSRKELEKLKADVEIALEKRSAMELKAAREAAAKAAAAHGFSLDDIAGLAAPAKKARAKTSKAPKAPARFSNPDNPDQTWTGKGRQPEWFKAGLKAGKTPDSMAI